MDQLHSSSIGVIGAGAWGTALAATLARAGRSVSMWGRDHTALMEMATSGENKAYLPGVRLAAMPHITRDLASLMSRSGVILLVIPAQQLRSQAPLLATMARPGQPMIICAKGIEVGTTNLMHEVVEEFMPDHPVGVLSGPTFAREVALGLPTAVTLAMRDGNLANSLASLLSSRTFRCYPSTDLLGVELGGAVKNVLAIACGISMGRRLGDNARAALITRGMAELKRLGLALGAKVETLMGLSGLGDIIGSCASEQSRNYSLGLKLGQGHTLAEIESGGHKLAEGRFTAGALVQKAADLGLEMPICEAVDAILNRHGDIDQIIAELLARPIRPEGV